MTPIPGGVNDPLRHTLQYRDTVTFQLGVLKKNKRLHSNVQHANLLLVLLLLLLLLNRLSFLLFFIRSAEVGAAVAYMAPRPYAH